MGFIQARLGPREEMLSLSRRPSRKLLLAFGYVASFACGWLLASGSRDISTVTREAKQVPSLQKQRVIPYQTPNAAVSHLLSQRPNWRTDYELSDWLPQWLPQETVTRWNSLRHNETYQHVLEVEMEMGRDDSFWQSIQHDSFSYSIANNGFGHRLGNLAFSYLCNVVPNKRRQIIFWDTPGNDYNIVWHALFQDSPVLMGAPRHWTRTSKFDRVNRYRKSIGQQGDLISSKGRYKDVDATHCDYKGYFPTERCGESCMGFNFSRDTWLLRLAQEPSAQEFFLLLRAQLRQRVKNKIAAFIENQFPKDKIVVGVHIRSGNGNDDGRGDFDAKKRGDWLRDLPAAVSVVRKHARMVAFSVIDRYNQYLDFDVVGNHHDIDYRYRIFLATDSMKVLNEFRRQDPNVLYLPQERMEVGAGVPINEPLRCKNMTNNEQCSIHAEEAMFMDAMIMSSCDLSLAESFSNWMYTLPATLRLAEGRIFCESGRASLGVKERDSVYGPASWWAHPPPNTMPVRCYQGSWTARNRFNLMAVGDVG